MYMHMHISMWNGRTIPVLYVDVYHVPSVVLKIAGSMGNQP